MKKLLKTIWPYLLILPVFLFVVQPILHDGLFHVYDNVQVTRTMAVFDEISTGQFPVRFFGEFGHGAGYFLMKYYSPLVYYLGALFHSLGLDFIKAIKLVYLVFLFTGTAGIWVLLRSLTKDRWTSTIGTLAFLLSPYLYHDFYHRGSLTEASAFMVIPWVIWSFQQMRQKGSARYLALTGLSLGATLMTHSLTGFMAIGLVVLLAVMSPLNWRLLSKAFIALLLSIGIAAFTIIPAFVDKSLVQYTNNDLVQRGYLDQPVLFWTNLTARGDTNIKTAFLGTPLFLGFFLLIFLFWRSPRFRKANKSLAIWVLIIMACGLFVMSPASSFIWASLEPLRYIQFPFRFLTIVTIAGVVGYTLLLHHFRRSKVIVLILFGLVLLQPLFYPGFYTTLGYQYGTEYKVEDPCMTTGWANEHLPVWVQKCVTVPLSLVTPLSGSVVVHEAKDLVNGRVVKFSSSGNGEVQIAKYYFPNWTDREDQTLSPSGEHGLIKMSVSGENTETSLHYLETPLEKASNYLTLFSLLVAFFLLVRPYTKL